MRASGWGDRNAPFFVMRPPVTLAQHEATKREIAAGWRVVTPVPPPVNYVHEWLKLIGLIGVLMVGIWFVATFIA